MLQKNTVCEVSKPRHVARASRLSNVFRVGLVYHICGYFTLFPSLTLMYGVGRVGTDPYSLSVPFSVKNITPDSGDVNELSAVQVG